MQAHYLFSFKLCFGLYVLFLFGIVHEWIKNCIGPGLGDNVFSLYMYCIFIKCCFAFTLKSKGSAKFTRNLFVCFKQSIVERTVSSWE